MGSNKSYWTGLEELHQTEEFKQAQENEFAPEVSIDEFLGDSGLGSATTGRRDFLKFLGFSLSAATLAACEAPVIKSIPYVNKPEDITPGVANWYSSTFYDGNDFANILVKTREGRPIYIKGNSSYGWTGGAINARINSSVLPLYDSARLQGPFKGGAATSWETADAEIAGSLTKIKAKGGKVVVLSNTIASPSTQAAIDAFKVSITEENGQFSHVQYDAVSYKAIRTAHDNLFGTAVIPTHDFSKAKAVVSVGADFLGSWLTGNLFTKQFAATRRPEMGSMSKHFQFETQMSVTGSNADFRTLVNPSDEGKVLVALYNHIAKWAGVAAVASVPAEWATKTEKAAKALWSAKGASLVVAGSNNADLQTVAAGINRMLENYGSTLDLAKPMNLFKGDEAELEGLIKEMNAGKVDGVILYGVNPAYNTPWADAFAKGMAKVGLSVAFSAYADETATKAQYILPDSHYLESWNDLSPVVGEYALTQPVINNLYDTRQAQQTLLNWSGNNTTYLEFIQSNWEEKLGAWGMFSKDFWNQLVHNGSYTSTESVVGGEFSDAALSAAGQGAISTKASGMELVMYQKTGVGTGNQVNNPWLQELPDPITKVTWDNYVTMAPKDVAEMGLNQHIGERLPASLVKVTVNGIALELPVFPTPGQKPGTVGVALGYGRGANGEKIGKSAFQTGEYGGHLTDENGNPVTIGKNAYPMVTMVDGHAQYHGSVTVEKVEGEYPLACTQTHHTLMGRDSIVRETSLNVFNASSKDVYNPAHTLKVHEGHDIVDKDIKDVDLWEQHPVENVGHRWGLSIDLSTCTGCSACITACHSENNVPVVGKDEVRRSRDMHWLRLDRYFSSEEDAVKADGGDFDYDLMEVPEDNPKVVHMPMMCQHCNHAPCETVCPVAATTHSNEGLNQMTYNRCIGTRYCANNCPYKVRRFNWFNYTAYKKFTEVNPSQDDMSRLVLNPDVVVRTRGVMEKCSMCVQKIQAGKLDAKKAGEPVQDGAIQTACAESCPTNAIVFGDLNDKKTENAKRAFGDRGYNAIEEVGTRPNVYYMVKVRNTEKA
ncbi:MAG: MoCo/4Fe-4S cofactor protein with predicted Tat translocation signal [Luteibaculaceae bacterium]|jgi:MoCo/4Fe-4S cofactor protein with predicted Tat translocation signal